MTDGVFLESSYIDGVKGTMVFQVNLYDLTTYQKKGILKTELPEEYRNVSGERSPSLVGFGINSKDLVFVIKRPSDQSFYKFSIDSQSAVRLFTAGANLPMKG